MACTDTGLKICILPAVLTLKPLTERGKKKKDGQKLLFSASQAALYKQLLQGSYRGTHSQKESGMRISITDFPTSSQIGMTSGHPSRCRLPGMGSPPLEWDFREYSLGITGSTEQFEGSNTKTHCLNKRTAALNPKLELHLQGDRESLPEQPPSREGCSHLSF